MTPDGPFPRISPFPGDSPRAVAERSEALRCGRAAGAAGEH